MNETELYVSLLEEQVRALRSVIMERDDYDEAGGGGPLHHNQWLKANAIAEVLNHIRRPSNWTVAQVAEQVKNL